MVKKRYLFFIFSLLAIFSFIPRDAEAIDNDCNKPEYYFADISVTPTRGQMDTSVIITGKFQWKATAPKVCKETNLRFDFSYDSHNGQIRKFFGDIKEFPFGTAAANSLQTHSFPATPIATLAFEDGDVIDLQLLIEDDDRTGLGDNLFDTPKIATFIVRIDTLSYACVAADGKYACSPGNKSDCSDVPNGVCTGRTCGSIKKEKCGSSALQTCGNGQIEGNEQCDDGNTVSGDGCSSLCANETGNTIGNCGGTGQPECPKGETIGGDFQVPNPLQGDAETVADLVGLIIKWLFSIAIPIAVAVIVYSGILFLTSKGNPAQVTKAKQFLTYAVIGLAIILVGSGFISLIRSILELSG